MATKARIPKFKGKPLVEVPDFSPHIYDVFGRELVKRVNSEYKGTPAGLEPYTSKKRNKPVKGSNIFNLFARDKCARELKEGDEIGARVMYPEESEILFAQERLPEQEQAYFDLGLVLDFSRANHDLALDVYQQLPERNLGTLPAVLLGLEPKKSDIGDYGLGFVYGVNSQLRHSPILTQKTGFFEPDDPELVRTGLPSKLGEETGRRLWTTTQYNPSEENLGLRRLCLNSNSGLRADVGHLANSSARGSVVLISAEGAQKNLGALITQYQTSRENYHDQLIRIREQINAELQQ